MPKANDYKLKRFWRKYKKNFNAKLATVLCIVATFILWYYFNYPEHEDALKFVTTIIVTFSGVFSAIYVGRGLSNKIHFDKVKNSFEFTSYFNSHEYNKLKEVCKNDYHAKNHSPIELVEKVKANTDLFYKLKSILNKFEDLSLAVQNHYVDESILYWSLDIILDFYTDNFKSYIEECREENRELYMELIKLHDCWQQRIYLSTGKPIEDEV